MDLRNNTITVGELLDDPQALSVFRRRFGQLSNHPLVQQNRTLTLAQLISKFGGLLPQSTVQSLLEELRRL